MIRPRYSAVNEHLTGTLVGTFYGELNAWKLRIIDQVPDGIPRPQKARSVALYHMRNKDDSKDGPNDPELATDAGDLGGGIMSQSGSVMIENFRIERGEIDLHH